MYDTCLYYAASGSFQHAIFSVSQLLTRLNQLFMYQYCIYTTLPPYLSILYGIMIYLGHCTNNFDFSILKTLEYDKFLNIYPIGTK